MNELTLIVTYRNRPKCFKIFLSQWENQFKNFCNLVFVEEDSKPKIASVLLNKNNVKYIFSEKESSAFNKSKLLNIALKNVHTKFFCAYDIDLISVNGTLFKHLMLAKKLRPNIIAGYRVNISNRNFCSGDYEKITIASENKPSALKKQLLNKERFGVNPIFQTKISTHINCYDENFIGWGCEDQDFLERYLNLSKATFVQSTDLLYLHINHRHEKEWKNEVLIDKNRQYYYLKRNKNDNYS